MSVALVTVRVKPGSRVASISREGDRLVVAVRERAVEGHANEAVRRALAAWLGVAPSRVRLQRGAAARIKTFGVEGLDQGGLARLRGGKSPFS